MKNFTKLSNKSLVALVSALLVIGSLSAVTGYYFSIPVANAHISGQTTPSPSTGLNDTEGYTYSLTITIHNNDLFANATMLAQGFTPNCRAWCLQVN